MRSSVARHLLGASISEEHKEIQAGDVLMIVFCLIICGIWISYCYRQYAIFRKIERFFPVSSANMIFGFLIGLVLSLAGTLGSAFSFDPEFFFIYLLPPIIFCAGYNVPKDFFFHNFGSIMAFAFVGTTISAVFIGSVLYAFGQAHMIQEMSFVKNMMLGSLISAVDPVAVILVLKSLNVDSQLKVLLFGESVLNDAASVVINRVFVSIADKEKSELEALAPALPLILGVALASMLIGVFLGLLIAFVFKKLSLQKTPEIELAAFFIGAFLPYSVAEALDMSGIMAVLFAGIMFDYYTFHHLSKKCQITTRETVQTLSYLAETFVFIYLGMSFFLEEGHYFSAGYVFVTLLLCLLGRALSVFPLAFLLNFGRKHKLPFKHQLILWYSGLRGPVAYALAVATPNDASNPSDNSLIITTTIFIVAVTTILLGGLSYPFLNWIKPPLMRSTSVTKTETYDISNHWFSRIDRRFLRPYFGPDNRRSKKKRTGAGASLVDNDTDAQEIEMEVRSDNEDMNAKLKLITEEDLHNRGIHNHPKQPSLSLSNEDESNSPQELGLHATAIGTPNTSSNSNDNIHNNNTNNNTNTNNTNANTNANTLHSNNSILGDNPVELDGISEEYIRNNHNSNQSQKASISAAAAATNRRSGGGGGYHHNRKNSKTRSSLNKQGKDRDMTATTTNTVSSGGPGIHLQVTNMKAAVDYSLPRSRPPSFIDNPQEISRSGTWSTTNTNIDNIQHPTSRTKSVTPPPTNTNLMSNTTESDLDLMTNINVNNVLHNSNSNNNNSNTGMNMPTPL